ncbi:hypothetical protein D3C87_1358040 [compost metagenome]
MLLHFPDHMNKLLVADAIARGNFHALVVFARADAAEHELFADLDRQLRTVGLGDQIQHQIDGSGAAGGGDAPTVDLEQFLGNAELRIGFLEGIDSLPMQGQAMTVEQACFGEDEAAGVDGAEGHAFVVQSAQPVFQCRSGELQRLEAGDHQQRRAFFQRLKRRIGVDRHSVAGQHRPAIRAQYMPAIQLAAKAIGDPQRLDGRDKSNGRETRHQQEIEILGHGAHSLSR